MQSICYYGRTPETKTSGIDLNPERRFITCANNKVDFCDADGVLQANSMEVDADRALQPDWMEVDADGALQPC
ncbi:unnamed protein product [Ilex paraguariensis]|uniref:Uncharacterized protein n=1 Tax=Ilex paraguariensis TaxID=185542 RepID=A0ABC8V126_9AQUA